MEVGVRCDITPLIEIREGMVIRKNLSEVAKGVLLLNEQRRLISFIVMHNHKRLIFRF